MLEWFDQTLSNNIKSSISQSKLGQFFSARLCHIKIFISDREQGLFSLQCGKIADITHDSSFATRYNPYGCKYGTQDAKGAQ
jgi:hypothetical protein